MEENPKRIKRKDNPYTIKRNGRDYIVSFKDGLGDLQIIKVTKKVYEIFDEYELQDKREMNEFDRHIEHSEIYENNLELRAIEKTISLEEQCIQNITFQELKRAIEKLPEIQKRRIKKYYFENKNECQIAEEERTTQQAINYSLSVARNNIKNYFKNFQF